MYKLLRCPHVIPPLSFVAKVRLRDTVSVPNACDGLDHTFGVTAKPRHVRSGRGVDREIEPKSEPIDDVSHTPNPNPNPTPIATVVPHDDVADNNNVLSEYNRIQELFRTAFPAKLEQQQTFDDVTDTSQAIVPVPDNQVADYNNGMNNNNGNGNMMTSSHRKSLQRKTRMIYDSLRVLVVMEDDKRRAAINVGGGALGSHARGDLKAASVMKDRGLWLNRDKRIVGAIPGEEHENRESDSERLA
ncbi:histone-lysine N-methyltransferase family member SUVH9-like protein [Tanacetum coccineum]